MILFAETPIAAQRGVRNSLYMESVFPLAFLDVGMPELVLILFVALLLFGGKKLPELARGLGQSIREFKKASAGIEEEIKRAIEAAPEPQVKAKPVLPVQAAPLAQVAAETPAPIKVEHVA